MAQSTYTPARGPGVTTAQAQTSGGLLGTQSRTSRGLDLDLDLFASYLFAGCALQYVHSIIYHFPLGSAYPVFAL